HRTHRRMITSSKCRPRNSAGRLRVTIHRTRSTQAEFATEPANAVLDAIRASTFKLTCEDRNVSLLFHFRIEGKGTDYPTSPVVSFGFQARSGSCLRHGMFSRSFQKRRLNEAVIAADASRGKGSAFASNRPDWLASATVFRLGSCVMNRGVCMSGAAYRQCA